MSGKYVMILVSKEKFFAWKCREFVITKLSFFMRQSVSSHHKDFMRGDIIKGVLICSKCNMSACMHVTLYKPRQIPFSFAKIRKHVDLKFKLVVHNIPMIIILVYIAMGFRIFKVSYVIYSD